MNAVPPPHLAELAEPPDRGPLRLRRVPISVAYLQDFLTKGLGNLIRVDNAVPDDARLRGVTLDGPRESDPDRPDRLVLLFEHPSFEPIAEGDTVPEQVPQFAIVDPAVRQILELQPRPN